MEVNRQAMVINVDESGRFLNPGQIEVTDLDLILYQRRKPPICWPLKTLRRYGGDVQLQQFTFEVGRRSPTGAGVYSFHCIRAEQLVALLETRLQVRPHSEPESDAPRRVSHRLSLISTTGPLSPVGSTSPLLESLPMPPNCYQNIYANDGIAGSVNSQGSIPTTTQDETNNNTLEENGPEHAYVNTVVGTSASDNEDMTVSSRVYMNIVPGTASVVGEYHPQPQPSQFIPWQPDEPLHNYANLDLEAELDGLTRQSQSIVTPVNPALNYIVLDLEQGTEPAPKSPSSSLPPDSPRKPPMGYATIDFDKTTALSHSVDPTFDDSDCSRKTRHNSTISQLPRNSSSLSE